ALIGPPEVPFRAIWAVLRDQRVRGVVARRRGGQLVAFGDDTALTAALTDLGISASDRVVPLALDGGDGQPDSLDAGLLAETLARALGRTRGLTQVLRTGQRHLIRVRDQDPGRTEDTAAVAPLRAAIGG